MDERTLTYTESDMVHVIVDGQVRPNKVPSRWVGTDLLPAGAKKATKSQVEKADGSDGSDAPAPPPADQEPAGNASRDAWEAYARTKGAEDADLVDEQGEPLGRDEIRAKYGTGS